MRTECSLVTRWIMIDMTLGAPAYHQIVESVAISAGIVPTGPGGEYRHSARGKRP